jgi:hypothetical protein
VKKLLPILFLIVLPASLHAQSGGFPSRGGGAVQGVVPQGQNAVPTNPVVSGALAPAVNANLAAVGLDTFGTSNVVVGNGFAGNVVLGSMPKPTNPGEWALVATDGGQDFAAAFILGSAGGGQTWTCFPNCGTTAGGLKFLTLSNVTSANTVTANYVNANSTQNRNMVAALFAATPTSVRQNVLVSASSITPASTLAGSTLVLAVDCGGNVAPCVSGMIDTQGNQWFQVGAVSTGSNTNRGISLWISSTPASPSSLTITPTVIAGGALGTLFFVELTGLPPAAPNQPAASLQSDVLGNLIVRQDAPGANLFNCSVTLSTNTTAVCQPIPLNVNGVPVRAYVTDFQLNTTTAGTATTIQLKYGTGGNCVTGTANLSAIAYPNTSTGITSIFGVRTPLIPAPSNAICATQAGTTAGTTVVELRGFLAP